MLYEQYKYHAQHHIYNRSTSHSYQYFSFYVTAPISLLLFIIPFGQISSPNN